MNVLPNRSRPPKSTKSSTIGETIYDFLGGAVSRIFRTHTEPPWLHGVVQSTSTIPSVRSMHEVIYLIGLIVVVMFVLGALGLR